MNWISEPEMSLPYRQDLIDEVETHIYAIDSQGVHAQAIMLQFYAEKIGLTEQSHRWF